MKIERKLQPLTIFEGPDCSGKSTLVNAFQQRNSANAIHHGPYPGFEKRLAHRYAEAARPLLDGIETQVWDRCWLSEPIYGQVFRNGKNRVPTWQRRHLERIALRHGAVVVLCLPPWETVSKTWLDRKGEEYLDRVDQLADVYAGYEAMETDLPVVLFDYTRHTQEALWREIERVRPTVHKYLYGRMVGNYDASVVLVGDKPSELNDDSMFHQWPFTPLSARGCSKWLTELLEKAKIRELELCWINANDGADVYKLKERNFARIVALGDEASATLNEKGIDHVKVAHPQAAMRFGGGKDDYELISYLKKALRK